MARLTPEREVLIRETDKDLRQVCGMSSVSHLLDEIDELRQLLKESTDKNVELTAEIESMRYGYPKLTLSKRKSK